MPTMSLADILTRRELAERILRASVVPGGAAFLAAWLEAGETHRHDLIPDPLTDYRPGFFNAEDFKALQAFTEILIPTDETPGAREARCAEFIDFVLRASDDAPQVQEAWRTALNALRDAGFHKAQPSRRLEIVHQMAQLETSPYQSEPLPAACLAYRLIKQQTVFAFYTSRQGTIETLDYRGNSYNLTFPACNHPEHKVV